jgi:hypothetical protein
MGVGKPEKGNSDGGWLDRQAVASLPPDGAEAGTKFASSLPHGIYKANLRASFCAKDSLPFRHDACIKTEHASCLHSSLLSCFCSFPHNSLP